MKHSSAQVIVVSDSHIGSTIGLCPPEVILDDGGKYRSNVLQAAAWDFWDGTFWPEVHRRAKKRKTIVVLNGDLVDGNHHGTAQIFTTSPLEQINLAAEILAPITSHYPVYVTRGTAAHVQASGGADEQVARMIGAQKIDAGRAVRSAYHLKMEFEGVLLDIAHHGPGPGKRIWTYGNEMRSYTRTIVLDALINRGVTLKEDVRPPDAVIRSHVHHKVEEIVSDYGHRCRGIITPAWQFKTEFAHKVVSHEDIADVGGVIISIDDGRISDVEFPLYPISQTDTVRVH